MVANGPEGTRTKFAPRLIGLGNPSARDKTRRKAGDSFERLHCGQIQVVSLKTILPLVVKRDGRHRLFLKPTELTGLDFTSINQSSDRR